MIDQPFREWISNRVEPLLKLYQKLRLTPNHVTILGLVFGLTAAAAVALNQYWIGLFWWWVGRIFDGTDGIYARKIKRVTPFGGYLDIVADMAAYSAMILGFSFSRPEYAGAWNIILFLYVLCITSALALGSLEKEVKVASTDNRSLRLAAGIAEGGETGVFYTLVLIFTGYMPWLCAAWILVLATTVIARTTLAWREFGSTK